MDENRTEELRRAVAELSAEQGRPAERILAELDFVRGLVRLHPAKAAAWGRLARKAGDVVATEAAKGDRARMDKAAAAAEEILHPIAKTAKSYTVHYVGHAHIDMNWMWSWPETVAVTNDTFTTVLKLMEEFEDFRFTQSQASVYEIVRRYNPELFERIRRRIEEGRWEVAAVHWVEGDKNLASGESLARHMLYTRAFVREQFGLSPGDAPVDWEPDTFGHAATIPTIVSAGGAKYYYLCRPGAAPRPPVFWWRGPDGSRVLVNRETSWYLNSIGPQNATAMLAFCQTTGLRDWMCVFGVGDHGGGPTRRDLLRAREMDGWPIYPRFRFATAKAYFELLAAEGGRWPEVEGELNFEFTGCYTSQSAIKKGNRLCEEALPRAESAAAAAWRAAGRTYPAGDLREAWIDTLFGQFHDILPGSGVRATREYQSALTQKALATAGMVATQSLRALAAKVDTSFAGAARPHGATGAAMGAGRGRNSGLGNVSSSAHAAALPLPAIIFNPCGSPREEVVTATVWDAEAAGNRAARAPWAADPAESSGFVARMPDGSLVAAQKVGSGDYWGHKYVELAFPVSVGALGYATAALDEGRADATGGTRTGRLPVRRKGETPSPLTSARRGSLLRQGYGGQACPAPPGVRCADATYGRWGENIRVGDFGMENEFLSVSFDPLSGGVARLVDKASGCDLADAADPLAVLEYVLEQPRGMSAWVIADPRQDPCRLELLSLAYEHKGPHLASVVAKFKHGDSDATVTYTLKAGAPGLEILLRVNWLQRGGREIGTPSLRMRLPAALEAAKARYEIPFGSIERPELPAQEVPALRWACVSGESRGGKAPAGLALLNDGKHGHRLEDSTLYLNLIRSSYEPDPLPELGEHVIRLALVPHGGTMAAADLHRLAAAFNQPLQVVPTDVHAGPLPAAAAGILSCEPSSVVVCGVKKAEDDDALIFRLLETAGENATAEVTLDETLLGNVTEAVEVDLLESPVAQNTAQATGNGFTVGLRPRGIASVKVRMGGP